MWEWMQAMDYTDPSNVVAVALLGLVFMTRYQLRQARDQIQYLRRELDECQDHHHRR